VSNHRKHTKAELRRAVAQAIGEGANPRGFSPELKEVYNEMMGESVAEEASEKSE